MSETETAEVTEAAAPATETPEATPEQRAHEVLFGGTDAAPEEPEAPAAETPAAETPAAEEDNDTRISRLYAQTTEAEGQMRRLYSEKQDLQERLAKLEEFDRALSADPAAALKARGLDPQQLIKQQLGMEDTPPTAEEIAHRAEERVAALENERKADRERATVHAQEGRKQELHGQVSKFLKDGGFDALATSAPAVSNLAARLYKEEREGVFENHTTEDITQYCRKLAEDYDTQLSTEVRGYVSATGAIDRLLADEATAKLIREKLGTPAPQSKPIGGQASDAAAPGNEPRTISDDMAAQSASPQARPDGSWDPGEARRRAAAAIAKSFTV